MYYALFQMINRYQTDLASYMDNIRTRFFFAMSISVNHYVLYYMYTVFIELLIYIWFLKKKTQSEHCFRTDYIIYAFIRY